MGTQSNATEDTKVTHLTAELLGKLTKAYGDSDRALCDRALAVHAALAYGVDVKTMRADMVDANRVDAASPVVSEATLAYARTAVTVAEMIGTDLRAWAKRDYKAVANVVRAANRDGIGVNTVKKAVRDALAPIDKSKHTEREEIANTVIDGLRSQIIPQKESTPRGKSGKETGKENGGEGEGTKETVSAEMTEAAAFAAIHALTAWLTTGSGTWSPTLDSHLSGLTEAAKAARRRGATATAKAANRTTETVAA